MPTNQSKGHEIPGIRWEKESVKREKLTEENINFEKQKEHREGRAPKHLDRGGGGKKRHISRHSP